MKKLFLTISVLFIALATFAQIPVKEPPISQERLKMYAYGAIAENNKELMEIYSRDKVSQEKSKASYENWIFYFNLAYQYTHKAVTKNRYIGNIMIEEPEISMYRLKMYAYGAIAMDNQKMMNIYAKDTSARAQKLAKTSYEKFIYYYGLASKYVRKVTSDKNDTGNTVIL